MLGMVPNGLRTIAETNDEEGTGIINSPQRNHLVEYRYVQRCLIVEVWECL